ncbi:MAG: response regulator [Rhodospirillales bacterium]|nr:response regulator [Rhodospirillales bacterium]MCW9001217.1 response regulator [Rhodospirillales bacterium]
MVNDKKQFENKAVLVIDDEPMMRKLLGGLLHDIGFTNVYEAEDGAEALKRLETSSDIDVVLCDLEMPIIGGLEFVGMLRSSKAALNPQVPVLIVTGHGLQKNVRDAVNLGIHGFLVKPVSRKALEDRIVRALKSSAIDPDVLTRKKEAAVAATSVISTPKVYEHKKK